MKKWIAIVLTFTMTMVVAACTTEENGGQEPEAPRQEQDGSQTEQQDNNAPEIETSSAGSGEILSTGPNGETAVNATTLSLTEEEKEQIRAGNYKAAICFHYNGDDWSASQLVGLQDAFDDLNIEIVAVTDADFVTEAQVANIESVMALNPDILISIPVDPIATADAFQRAVDAGIQIVFMDNVPSGFVAGENYVSCVSADNYGNGIIAADLIGEALNGQGDVGVIYYDADFFVTNQRLEAFEKTMAEKYPNINIVSKLGFQDVNGCSEVADVMLTQNPNIDAIFAHWDVPCEGVLSSLRAGGYTDVLLSTIDLGNNIAREIADGNVLGLGAQLPYDQGVAEATLAAYALLGKEAPAYVAVPAKRVDQSNILQAYEDVYHVPAPAWLVEAANN